MGKYPHNPSTRKLGEITPKRGFGDTSPKKKNDF